MSRNEPSENLIDGSATSQLRSVRRSSVKHALTLVELLVVILLIGVLMAILLPAVQAARESGRRTQCANNMRQIAMAVLNYEGAHELLPASGIVHMVDPKEADPSDKDADRYHVEIFNHLGGKRFSWLVLILPYVEQQALYDQIDFSKTVFAQIDDPQSTYISLYACPSDDPAHRYYDYEYLKVGSTPYIDRFAKGNYAGYVSPFHVDLQMLYPGALIAGGQSLGQIADGISHTLLLSEVRTLDHQSDQRGAWALPFAGSSLLAFDMHPIGWADLHDGSGDVSVEVKHRAPFVPNPDSRDEAQPPNNQGPNKDTLEFKSDGVAYAEVAALAENLQMPCTWRRIAPGINGYNSAAPRSLHPGGVNASYLDGRVEFQRDDVDAISQALQISVNDGESR